MARRISQLAFACWALAGSFVLAQSEPALLPVSDNQPVGKLPSQLLEEQLPTPKRLEAPTRMPVVDPDDPPQPPTNLPSVADSIPQSSSCTPRTYSFNPLGETQPRIGSGVPSHSPQPGGNWFHDTVSDNCGWFGSASALGMTRTPGPRLWTTVSSANPDVGLLNTQSAGVNWAAGADVRFGRIYGCQDAWEIGAWGVFGLDGSSSLRDVGNGLSTSIDLTNVAILGTPATNFFDNAREHRLTRDNSIYSIEWNWLRGSLTSGTSASGVDWLTGARYFYFSEDLLFGSVSGGNEFGSNGGANEAYLDTRVRNHLIGLQFGARAAQCVGDRWQVFASPVVGIYGNNASVNARIYRGDGVDGFTASDDKIAASVLAQFDAGARVLLTPNCAASFGYRIVSASGVALADNQIPAAINGAGAFNPVNTQGHLLLHGAFLGLDWRY